MSNDLHEIVEGLLLKLGSRNPNNNGSQKTNIFYDLNIDSIILSRIEAIDGWVENKVFLTKSFPEIKYRVSYVWIETDLDKKTLEVTKYIKGSWEKILNDYYKIHIKQQ